MRFGAERFVILPHKNKPVPPKFFSATDQAFIQAHLTADVNQLLLKHGREKQPLIAQIEARQKARHKLPTWVAQPDSVFPVGVSVEQSSSEATAQYKANLVSGKLLIDLTGGMGVDSSFFATRFERVIYAEQNEQLVAQAQHNFAVLGIENITCICANSIDFLQQFSQKVDCIYADPARRVAQASSVKRVYALADCEPDILKHLPLLLEKSEQILLKTSPLLDIKQTLQELKNVQAVHAVAVENEVKELLFVLNNQPNETLFVHATNLPHQFFSHDFAQESVLTASFSDPLRYVYEPNAAILKTGAFKSVATQFGLHKIAPNSHLYTSNELITDFPGRIFALQAIVKADAKALSPFLPDCKANLTLRNFPATTNELRKKLRLKDGGNVYLLATTLANGDKKILVCGKS